MINDQWNRIYTRYIAKSRFANSLMTKTELRIKLYGETLYRSARFRFSFESFHRLMFEEDRSRSSGETRERRSMRARKESKRWRKGVEKSSRWSMEREIWDLRGDGNTGQQAAALPPRRLVYRAISQSVLSTRRRYEYTRHKTRFIAKHSPRPSYNGLSMKEAEGARQGE